MSRANLAVVMVCAAWVVTAPAWAVTTVHYPDVATTAYGGTWYEGEVAGQLTPWYRFDLTQADITMRFTLDLSAVTSTPLWTNVGLHNGREASGPAKGTGSRTWFAPTDAGGWLAASAQSLAQNDNGQDLNDSLILAGADFDSVYTYDVMPDGTVQAIAFGTGVNHGMWFDRGGVDIYQASHIPAVDGGTFNTGGIYQVEIIYHQVGPNQGTMFATINGVQQGFWTGGWSNSMPDLLGVGRSFTADLTELSPFISQGAWGGGSGTTYVRDLSVTGVAAATPAAPPIPEPATMLALTSACVGLGGYIRRRRG